MIRALQIFLGADMRNGHEGLAALAKKEKIDVAKLEAGQFVIFINNEKNKIKLYGAHNVVAYLKWNNGRIDMRTIQLIPQAFNASGRIDYDVILKEVIEKELGRVKRK